MGQGTIQCRAGGWFISTTSAGALVRNLAGLSALLLGAAASGGRGIGGTAYDAYGKPLAGVWIEARRVAHGSLDRADFSGPPARSMCTGPDGYWSVADLESGSWLVTAVASKDPRSPAELQEFVAPRAEPLPRGIAVTRLFRRLDPRDYSLTDGIDIGLAVGSETDHPIAGRLVGAFEPQRFGYQITVQPFRPPHTGRGTMNVSSADPSFAFSAVPAGDGSFSFGALKPDPYDSLQVEVFALEGPDDARCRSYFTQFLKLDTSAGPLELPLPAAAPVRLQLRAADGEVLPAGQRTFEILAGAGTAWNHSATWYRDEDTLVDMCCEGSYAARATVGPVTTPEVTFSVAKGSEVADVVLAFPPCPRIKLRLVDQHGRPLEKLAMQIRPPATLHRPTPEPVATVTCIDGAVELEHVYAGNYDVEFLPEQGRAFSRTLDLKPDAGTITIDVP
ncbi:MAG TPA: hypothetical protein VFY71_13635 [Planctomycetota bacterium]|nr:hypothetical protein [Planctomycetota bacterium]